MLERGVTKNQIKQQAAGIGSPALGMGTVKTESLYKHGKMVSVRRQESLRFFAGPEVAL